MMTTRTPTLAAFVNGYAVRPRSLRAFQGGLGPVRLRTVRELVYAKMEDELTLIRNGAIGAVEPSTFFADVQEVYR